MKINLDHNDSLDENLFRGAACGFHTDPEIMQRQGMGLIITSYERVDSLLLLDPTKLRFCLAVRQDETEVDVSYYVSYIEQTKKHYIGRLNVATNTYTEREALQEWRGYADFFDYTSPSFYATMKRDTTYIHATVSGPPGGFGLSDTSYQELEHTVLPNDFLASESSTDVDNLPDQFTPLPMGIALIVETSDGTL